jgi:hypothetical protein
VLPVPIRVTLACGLIVWCVAGCASTVQGAGEVHTSPSSQHDFPSTSSGVPNPLPDPSLTPSPTDLSTTAAPLSRAARIRTLVAQTNGEANDVVAVPTGYDAATWDQHGGIQFWHDDPDTLQWQQVGQSRYPYAAALGPPHARVIGALLTGMQHATFIARGVFSGDGSGNAVAFTDGPRGWGAIKAEPNGNIGPSGAPVGPNRIGLAYGFGFLHGDLVTADCPLNVPISECGSHAILKRWVWNGQDFNLAR